MSFTKEWLNSYEARRLAQTPAIGRSIADGIANEIGKGGLHEKIQAECERRGWIALHGSTAHRAMRTVGEWDFVILADNGRVLLVEAKSKSGKLTTEQSELHAWAKRLGYTSHVVRSMEDFYAVAQNKGTT